jgi:DNA replication protein DnaC
MVKEDGVERVAPCPDCRRARLIQSLLDQADIPPRYRDRGFDIYSVHHPSQERALKRSIEYVEAFPDVPRGLLFAGPCGVGKTHLSVAILKKLIIDKQVRAVFVDETELLRRLQYSYGPDAPETEREVMLPLMQVDLLVWDDLGTGRGTEWARETLRTILNHRYTASRQTILSTNRTLEAASQPTGLSLTAGRLSEEGLSERIGQHLYSRLMEMCEVVEIKGPDARIEIHKAGADSAQAKARSGALVIPDGLLRCPQCDSPRLTRRSQPKSRSSAAGRFFEVSCSCEKCGFNFAARFFERTGKVEYPPG